ncbi:MAG: helix-turn-helix domain-containing protein [Gemmataceae bacterium]
MGQRWTPADDDALRELYVRGVPRKVLHQQLPGRTMLGCKRRLERLGLYGRAQTFELLGAKVRALHTAGLHDAEIGRRLGKSREQASRLRRRLGLPLWPVPAKVRRAAFRKQAETLGEPIHLLARWQSRVAAYEAGWPAGCTLRQGDYLEALRRHGPLTAAALAVHAGTGRWAAFRMLTGLRREGWVERAGKRR